MPKSGLNQATSLYIHIPFCKSKCHYCNFISFADKKNFIDAYFQALFGELEFYFSWELPAPLKTLYIGGGTPSVISASYYEKLFDFLKKYVIFEENPEITMEINPATVDFDYLQQIAALGINRLSIGAQSFNDKILAKINRKHNSDDIKSAINMAKQAGFNNISLDLIYGLPQQTLDDWQNSLQCAVNLEINHISTYGLKIEPDSYFGKNLPLNIPDDELQSEFYLQGIDFLTKNGFNHYEISNFAKKSYESRHNLTYWLNQEYFGVGIAAHGYLNGERYSNTESFDDYIKNSDKIVSKTKISSEEKLNEEVMLGLRLAQGIDVNKLKQKYGFDFEEKFSREIKKYSGYGMLTFENSVIKLTPQGFLMSNYILSEFT